MKSFKEITQELNEAKFKAPRGTKELKRDFVKAGSKKIEIVYVQNNKKQVEVYIDGTSMGDPYKDMKVAEKEMKDIKKVLKQMSEDFNIEEFKGFPAEKWANADDGSIFEELDELFVTELKPEGTDHFSSMAQDTSKNRHSEIQYMNGFISNEGRKIGIPTPANDAVTVIISEIDLQKSRPTPENIKRALEMM